MQLIQKRWNQNWLYVLNDKFVEITSFEKDNIDDICIGIWIH